MDKLLKILAAVLGAPLAPVMLLAAWMQRLRPPPRPAPEETILLYSQVIWDEVWQRPQQYAWRAAQDRPVIYCCPVQLHNLLTLKKRWRPVRRVQDGERDLLVLSPLIFSGHFKSRLIHEMNCRITAAHISLALPPAARIHALVNTPFALPVIKSLFYQNGARDSGLARLVYDEIDDFTVFEWAPPFGKSFDARLANLADTIIAGTHELADSRDNAVFIPCGVDFNLFAAPAPPPPDLASLPRPIIGYFGTISERVDLQLLARIAGHFTQASLVMIGPVHLPLQNLPQARNINYLGLRPHADLPAYAQAFDVALIPFRITPATLKLNPVKMLEYLAAGLPVVSAPLPDVERFYSHVAHIAGSHDEFIREIEAILAQPDHGRISRGVELARQASWNEMVAKINEALFPSGKMKEPASAAETARP